jgi:hypothetical protein
MNAFGPSLTESQIYKSLAGVHRCLRAGGLLVVGTAGEARTLATIFRRSTSGFVAAKDLNGGATIRDIIERFEADSSVMVPATIEAKNESRVN